MRLVSNAGNGKSHLTHLLQIIDSSERIIICSGWMKKTGLKKILPAIDRALARGASVTVYSNAMRTGKSCASELARRPRLFHISTVRPYLHSKLYYGEAGESFVAMLGSANITEGGLEDNDELSVCLAGAIGDATHIQLDRYLQQLSDSHGS